MTVPQRRRRAVAGVVALVLALALVPAPVAAEEPVGGTVVVAEGETVSGDLHVVAERVLIAGTVTGDLDVVAGSLIIEGTVEGSVDGAVGSARVSGTVEGDLHVGAGSVIVSGNVGGTARLGADSITFLPGATIDGDLRYDAGRLTGLDNVAVGGQVVRAESVDGPWSVPAVPTWAGTLYLLLANLALGAVLLALLPDASTGVVARVRDRTLRSGGAGLLTLVATPVVLALLALTVMGIPVALLGLGAFLAAMWVGLVYGCIAVGAWLLSLRDVEDRWIALVLGVPVVALVGAVPWLGGIVQFLVLLLLGLGAVGAGGLSWFRHR
ncbi:MAG: polymer-forming cytoskeletal protein [Halobacteriaceae archaeon]